MKSEKRPEIGFSGEDSSMFSLRIYRPKCIQRRLSSCVTDETLITRGGVCFTEVMFGS